MASFTTIVDLPNEVLQKIFSYCCSEDLLKLSLVCKHWSQLCKDSSLLKNIVITSNLNSKTIKIILLKAASCLGNGRFNLKIVNRSDLLQILYLITEYVPLHQENSFSIIIEQCCCWLHQRRKNNTTSSNYVSLPINNLSSLNKNSFTVKDCCREVTSMVLDFFFVNVFDDKFIKLFCTNLEKIDGVILPYLDKVCQTDVDDRSLSCYCKTIKKLVLYCENLLVFRFDDYCHNYFFKKHIFQDCRETMNIIFNCLCTFNLQLRILKITAANLSDDDILLINNLKNITVLHLYSASFLSASSLEVFQNLSTIKSFLLTENLVISPQEWKNFIEGSKSKSTETLILDECLVDNSVMIAVSRTYKNLLKISLNGCRDDTCQLTSEGLKAVFDECHKLQEVSLCYVDKELQCALSHLPISVKIDFIPIN